MVAKKAAAAATKSAPKEAPSHPPYGQMILSAITDLKDKKGSSRLAIIKYITSKYNVGENVNVQVRKNLIRMSDKNEIVHSKSSMSGASGSFKLPTKTGATPKKTPKKASSPKKEDSPVKTKSPKKAASPKKAKVSPKKPTAKKASKK